MRSGPLVTMDRKEFCFGVPTNHKAEAWSKLKGWAKARSHVNSNSKRCCWSSRFSNPAPAGRKEPNNRWLLGSVFVALGDAPDYTALSAAMTGKREARIAGKKLPKMPTSTEKPIPLRTNNGVMRKRKTNSLKLSKLMVPMLPK